MICFMKFLLSTLQLTDHRWKKSKTTCRWLITRSSPSVLASTRRLSCKLCHKSVTALWSASGQCSDSIWSMIWLFRGSEFSPSIWRSRHRRRLCKREHMSYELKEWCNQIVYERLISFYDEIKFSNFISTQNFGWQLNTHNRKSYVISLNK